MTRRQLGAASAAPSFPAPVATAPERMALAWIADHADLFLIHGQPVLAFPCPPAVLDALASVGAEAEHMELDADAEDNGDDEPAWVRP